MIEAVQSLNALTGIGYLLLIVGLAAAVIPVLPGPLLIWLGAFVWAWGDGFARIGWVTLTILGVLAIAAWASDLFLSTVVSRRAGASWRAIGGAIVGGLVGSALLSGVFLLGTILGALLGAVAGMWLVEYWIKGDWGAATRAVRAYIRSVILASLIEMTVALVMLGIFVGRAFF